MSTSRQAAIDALAILDTPREPAYDAVMRLLRRNLRAPMAALSILDGERCFYKSEVGLDCRALPSENSFTAAVVAANDFMAIADASVDDRFSTHELVKGEKGVKGFFGHPVHAPDRTPVGCLGVYDTKARSFDDNDQQALLDLATLVERMMATRAPDTSDPLRALLQRRQSDSSSLKGAASRIPISLLVINLGGTADLNLDDSEAEAINNVMFSECRRAGDFVARSSDSEFFAMLPNTDADGASCIAERMTKALTGSGLRGTENVTIGAAIVATTAGFSLGWSHWSDVADRALMRAMRESEPENYIAKLL